MIHLSRGNMTADITETGAQLRSLCKDGFEYIWSGDPRVWEGTAPVLFPALCSLKDDSYTLDGIKYHMTKHGFVRNAPFAVEQVSDTSVTLLYTHTPETLVMYPFEFEFRVIFTLLDSGLRVEYRVNNQNDRNMYFSVGAHEAYATPEGIEDYDIIFPCREDLDTVLLDGGLLQKNTMTIAKDTQYLPLYDKYFILDTLIFRGLRSRSLVLRNRKSGREVKVSFPQCDYLGIWHKPSAGYICIEPWAGLPDNADTTGDITRKEGIVTLEPCGVYSNIHTIEV